MTDAVSGNLLHELLDFGGRISRAVFLTYGFDPEYFAEFIYPALRECGCERTLVLLDAAQYGRVTNFGALASDGRLVIEHYRPGITFHPKLFLLTGVSDAGDVGNVGMPEAARDAGARRNRMRCALGSANLTRAGFETNRELFTILTEDSGLASPLGTLLSHIRSNLNAGTASDILHETEAELRAVNHAIAQAGASSSKPDLVWNGLDNQHLWRSLTARVPPGQLDKAVIVSPFFDAPERFDQGLLGTLLDDGVQVDLFVDDVSAPGRIPRDGMRSLMRRSDGNLSLYRLDTGGQTLHGKLLVLMTANSAWLQFGSPNFTSAALQGQNVEVALVIRLPRAAADRYLSQLLRGTPLRSADELPAETRPVPDPAPLVTHFIDSAVLSLGDDRLTVTLDRPARDLSPNVAQWLISFNGQAIPPHVLQTSIQLHARIIVLNGMRQYTETPDGIVVGPVEIRIIDPGRPNDLARDWRLAELAPGEALTGDGLCVEPAHDLSTFVFALTQPRALVRPTLQGDITGASNNDPMPATRAQAGIRSYPSLNFADIEGRLDVAYRFANSLAAHFGRLITDPHTVHRWRSSWLRAVDLLSQDETLTPLGRQLIALRLLHCLNDRLGHVASERRLTAEAWRDDRELVESLRTLSEMSAGAPGADALSLVDALASARSGE